MLSRRRRLAGFIRNLFTQTAQNEELFSESLRNFATTQSLPDSPASSKPRVTGVTRKIRARKSQLLSIVYALGRQRAEVKLEFRISNAVSDADLIAIRSDVYSLLARERGEAYAMRVLAGVEVAQPRKAAPEAPDSEIERLKRG